MMGMASSQSILAIGRRKTTNEICMCRLIMALSATSTRGRGARQATIIVDEHFKAFGGGENPHIWSRRR